MTTYLYPKNLKATANLWLGFERFCNNEHSAFIINPYTCTDEDNSTACSNTLLRIFLNPT